MNVTQMCVSLGITHGVLKPCVMVFSEYMYLSSRDLLDWLLGRSARAKDTFSEHISNKKKWYEKITSINRC